MEEKYLTLSSVLRMLELIGREDWKETLEEASLTKDDILKTKNRLVLNSHKNSSHTDLN